MTFIDPLAFQLFTLAFVSALLFYSGISDYLTYFKKGARTVYQYLKSQVLVLGVIGIVILGIGLWGELNWPLTTIVNGTNVLGAYNILFYDPYLMLGIVLVGFSASVMLNLNTRYIGLLAVITGALSVYYGVNAYSFGLTTEPLVTLLLYVAFGFTAILTFPITVFIDNMIINLHSSNKGPSKTNKLVGFQWKLIFTSFVLFLLFAAASTILALVVGGGALTQHLINPP
jgi:putative membrane protein